ncbi:MAG: NTP transferase domain-containing protein [Vicinamibacterales bacterium]
MALLVGGQGRRLGGLDKSALIVDGRSIRDRQIAEARFVTPHVMAVSSSTVVPGDIGIPCVTDYVAGGGALGGLVTALTEAPTDVVVVVACDMPFVTGAFLHWLASRLGGAGSGMAGAVMADVVMPSDGAGSHPLCAAYHTRAAVPLGDAVRSGVRRVQDALSRLTVLTVGPEDYATFDPDGRLLLNVNTPRDYHAALNKDP